MGPTGYLPSSNDPDLGNISLNKITDAFDLRQLMKAAMRFTK